MTDTVNFNHDVGNTQIAQITYLVEVFFFMMQFIHFHMPYRVV
jgi:hypothetical protein